LSIRWLVSFVSILCLVDTGFVLADSEAVRFPREETEFDKRQEYPLRLLRLAFKEAESDYKLVPSNKLMQQDRALKQLQYGIDVDVVWSMTSRERESNLYPIRIPIYKGLIGWRIFLAHAQDLPRIIQVQELSELRKLHFIQGHDWPDIEILRANGFSVHGAPDYISNFSMLEHRRVDLFPRSILEIWSEFESHKNRGIVIEPTKLFIYPAAFYYFVHPSNKLLANTIDKGLRMALADGSFDTLFDEYHLDVINQLEVKNRQIFRLNNPLLPAETPLSNKVMWFSLPKK